MSGKDNSASNDVVVDDDDDDEGGLIRPSDDDDDARMTRRHTSVPISVLRPQGLPPPPSPSLITLPSPSSSLDSTRPDFGPSIPLPFRFQIDVFKSSVLFINERLEVVRSRYPRGVLMSPRACQLPRAIRMSSISLDSTSSESLECRPCFHRLIRALRAAAIVPPHLFPLAIIAFPSPLAIGLIFNIRQSGSTEHEVRLGVGPRVLAKLEGTWRPLCSLATDLYYMGPTRSLPTRCLFCHWSTSKVAGSHRALFDVSAPSSFPATLAVLVLKSPYLLCLASWVVKLPSARQAPVCVPNICDLDMSDGIDLDGMRLFEDINNVDDNIVDERVHLEHCEQMLNHFETSVLNNPNGNHIIDGNLTFDDYGRRAKSKKQTARASKLHESRLKDGSYREVTRSGVWKDRDGKTGIVYLSWADLASRDKIHFHGLPPALQNLAVWSSQHLFAECPVYVKSKDPRHEMYQKNPDVVGTECICHTLPRDWRGKDKDDDDSRMRRAWQERIQGNCERQSINIAPGYLDGREWTEEEEKILAQDYDDVPDLLPLDDDDDNEDEDEDEDEVEEVIAGEETPTPSTSFAQPSPVFKAQFINQDAASFDPKPEYHFEACGLTHLVHAWVASGHQHSLLSPIQPTAKLVPSAQMLGAGTARRACAVKSYLLNTRVIHEYLAMCLRRTVPSEWEVAKPVYDAGQWIAEDTPNGFALGRAILWKLQVAIHRDTQDGLGNFCVAFNCGRWVQDGQYGGGMAFPDLGLIFDYPPGSILIFRSADLFHGVMPWQPALCDGQSISPGRISWVMFNSQAARRILAGKPRDWLVTTNQGQNKYQVRQLALRQAAEQKAARETAAKNEQQAAKAAERRLKRHARGKEKEDSQKRAKASSSTSYLDDVE
ncbi:hypothetical protein SISSUDRAFT_1038321 [Sistotremastrum suecicum HHB10207 ss-3]|uniref:Uncharacterized protein n=1 Tax=Sistotremastrum suecicum HHB10207 ss-3 TaxID=1314776 RepID=A0A165WXA9_9AGAM|nr:hypothetical protein SISSUDRAFT_1038321 [Sistotremastrum suecicum HHB10207 ss-3]